MLEVHDNVTSPEFCAEFRKWFEVQTLIYGWKGLAGSNGEFWHRNFVLPGMHKNHYDKAAVDESLTFDNLLAQSNPLSVVAMHVSQKFFNGKKLSRVWANVQGFGNESAIHKDFPIEFRGNAKSVVWYPVEEWDANWGGDICTFDDNGEITSAALVKPDRMVAFDGTILHCARPISRYTNKLRLAIAFGLETQEGQ